MTQTVNAATMPESAVGSNQNLSQLASLGRLWGIGLGPGDPQLLTLRAVAMIRAVDVIAYTAPEGLGESFARSIAAAWLDRGVPEYALRLPMTLSRHPAGQVYDRAARELAEYLDRGQSVGFLCQGDPLFYGSFIYLMNRLAGKYPLEIIPGVSSLTAAAAAARFPLAGRSDCLTVVPAPLDDAVIRHKILSSEAVVLLKLGRHFSRIKALLEALGLVERAIFVERATMAEQRILPLSEVTLEQAPYFALILVRHAGVE
ncbi:MAG: precorrin-2 C(20)-methyltransferase [Alphaproteobacteria bacterium]|nr:precorrin-2 C(20)-methyltransferase [Alphaproteobacteria bacterium]